MLEGLVELRIWEPRCTKRSERGRSRVLADWMTMNLMLTIILATEAIVKKICAEKFTVKCLVLLD